MNIYVVVFCDMVKAAFAEASNANAFAEELGDSADVEELEILTAVPQKKVCYYVYVDKHGMETQREECVCYSHELGYHGPYTGGNFPYTLCSGAVAFGRSWIDYDDAARLALEWLHGVK